MVLMINNHLSKEQKFLIFKPITCNQKYSIVYLQKFIKNIPIKYINIITINLISK